MDNLNIYIKPFGDEAYQVKYFDVKMELEYCSLKQGEKAAELWNVVAGVPGCSLEGGMKAEDEKGVLPLTMELEPGFAPGFEKRVWKTGRAADGPMTLSYRFYPRNLEGVDRGHPLFDICNEPLGVTLCGVTCLAAVKDQQWQVHMEWDLSEMPENTKVVSIKGNDFAGTPGDYTFTLFALGDVKTVSDESGRYGMHWLAEPLPDEERLSSALPALIKGLCRFFRDEEIPYHVFFRKDPFDRSNSGTAFDNGFIFGYSDAMPVSVDASLNTLAHEITHNWPRMKNDGGEGNWFNEGTAEYYSMVIPYRCGLISTGEMAAQLTEKSRNYYGSSCQHMSNEQVHQLTWNDRDAQRLPYGRGLFYLAETDARLRERTGGEVCVDDLVLALVEMRKSGTVPSVQDWEGQLARFLGEEEIMYFRQVMDGKNIDVNPDWFCGMYEASMEQDGSVIWKEKEGLADVRF